MVSVIYINNIYNLRGRTAFTNFIETIFESVFWEIENTNFKKR